MMLTIKKLFAFSAIILITQSCVKKEIELNNLESETFDPSFATSLGGATFNMGRLESHFIDDKFEYNPVTGLLEYVYKKRLFELGLSDIFQLPALSATASVGMPPAQQTALTTGGVGTVVNFSAQVATTFPVSNGELLDSIIIKQGTMDITLSSDFTHSGSVNVVIPSLTLNGASYSTTLVFNYTGITPVLVNANALDISGYTLDMTDGGITDNTSRFAFNAQITSSGLPLTGTESLDFTVNLTVDTIQQANGYFGSYTNILARDTAFIDFFENISGDVHIEDPRIDLTIYNTSGISVETDFTAISAPDNSTQTVLGGPALTSIPTILGATTISDTGVTTHLVNNSNTTPTLTQVIDEGPGKIIYDASSTTNQGLPNTTQNFITYKSKVWCDSRLVLPLYGWGNNFTFIDTTNADLEDLLGIDSDDADDVEQVSLRIITDNGLPIEARIQVYFTDSNDVIIDSLFNASTGEDIIRKANVNFSVPVNDNSYGTVTSPVRKITDIVINKARFNNLANSGAKKIIYKAQGLTNEAPTGKNVKFLPSYSVSIKMSAKVDLNINIKK